MLGIIPLIIIYINIYIYKLIFKSFAHITLLNKNMPTGFGHNCAFIREVNKLITLNWYCYCFTAPMNLRLFIRLVCVMLINKVIIITLRLQSTSSLVCPSTDEATWAWFLVSCYLEFFQHRDSQRER